MASPTSENARRKLTLKASRSNHREPMEDGDRFVGNGVSRVNHERATNGDKSDVIALMEIARDGPLKDFYTAWGHFKNSKNSTFVNLNRAVALNGVNFKAQHKAIEKLYEVRDGEIEKILEEIETMRTLEKDGDWKTKFIGENSRVGKKEEQVPVIWNARSVIYPGRTALHMAAANGQVDIVGAICQTPKVDFQAKDVFGYTPLHLACYSRSENKGEVITKLLEKMDPNVAANEKGFYFTALHLAVKSKSTDIVDMLLDWNPKGVNVAKVLDVGAKSGLGLTALHLAVTEAIAIKMGLELKLKLKGENLGEDRKDFESMIADRDDFELMIAAMIRFMNNKSPEAINKSDRSKSTPLHTCVKAKDYRLVEILLDDGDKIDPELLDNKRRTALEIALHQRDYAMVHILQSYLECAGIVGNHQAYADSATAILVGAALLVTVTFAAWVQIPTNDSTVFWVFISLSFYFAVATFIAAASAAIPSKGSTLGIIRRAVLLSAFCLAISLACAVAAFAIAGFLIVPPSIEHQRKVIATTVVGGFVCLFCLLSFVGKIFEASGLFFLMLDLFARQQLEKYIYKPVVKTMPGKLLVDALGKWYNAWYKSPVDNFFKLEKEDVPPPEASTSSRGNWKSGDEASTPSPGNWKSGDEASTSSPGNWTSGDEASTPSPGNWKSGDEASTFSPSNLKSGAEASTSSPGNWKSGDEALTSSPGNWKSGDEALTSSPGNWKSGDESGNSVTRSRETIVAIW